MEDTINKTLSVGDKVYKVHFNNEILAVMTVKRLTKTTAVCGNDCNSRFKLGISTIGQVFPIVDGGGFGSVYFVVTPELEKAHFRQCAIKKLRTFHFSQFDTAVLLELLEIIESKINIAKQLQSDTL